MKNDVFNNNDLINIAAMNEDEAGMIINQLSETDENPNMLPSDIFSDKLLENQEIDSDDEMIEFVQKYNKESFVKMYEHSIASIIKNNKLLSKAEEIELAKLAKNGDEKAREKLILSNIRLVISNIRKYRGCGIPVNDLMQEGIVGLIIAVDKYDYSRNFKFSTYASWWILQRIRKAIIEKNGSITIPAHMYYKLKKLMKCQSEYVAENHKKPDTTELATLTGFPEKVVKKLLNLPKMAMSLDEKIDSESDETVLDFVGDDETNIEDMVEHYLEKEQINTCLQKLSPRELLVIKMYYMEHKSLQEIADTFFDNMSRARIHQIKRDAIEKLRYDERLRNLI